MKGKNGGGWYCKREAQFQNGDQVKGLLGSSGGMEMEVSRLVARVHEMKSCNRGSFTKEGTQLQLV